MSRFILIALLTVVVVAGCASSTSPNVYPRNQVRQAWNVEEGKVTDIKEVMIEGDRTALGSVGGGYIGYELGRTVGGGRANTVAGAVGAVAGAVAGEAVEERVTRDNGLQITVELDKGASIAVVQAADEGFQVGERVKILRRDDGAARVTKI